MDAAISHWTHVIRLCRVVSIVVIAQCAGAARADEIANGRTAFAACTACHSTDGSKRMGPSLNGLIGRKAGSASDFNYSPAMRRATIVWDAEGIDKFLANPQREIPGNRMPFSGIADGSKRADIAAYLATLKQ
jgi:cytochrome c